MAARDPLSLEDIKDKIKTRIAERVTATNMFLMNKTKAENRKK